MIFIISMHRSGSSLLAGLLSQNGFELGPKDQLIPGNKDNERGFFERRDVVNINEYLLSEGGYSHMLPRIDYPLRAEPDHSQVGNVANLLIQSGVQVVKDPRFCLTLDVWTNYFDSIKLVFITRSPSDVAESLNRRQKYPLSAGLALWEYYNTLAVGLCQRYPHYHLGLEELISNQEETIVQLLGWLRQEEFNKQVTESIDAPNLSLYKPSLLHSRSSLADGFSLSESQTHLWENIRHSGNKIKFDLGPKSESMQYVLTVMDEFKAMGYAPGSGRLVDNAAEQNLTNLRNTVANLRNTVTSLQLGVSTQKKKVSSLQDEVKAKETTIRLNQEMIEEQSLKMTSLRDKLNVSFEWQKKTSYLLNQFLISRSGKLILFLIKVFSKSNGIQNPLSRLKKHVDESKVSSE